MKTLSKNIILTALTIFAMNFAIGGFSNFATASTGGFSKGTTFSGVDIPKNAANDDPAKKILSTAFLWAGIIAVIMVIASGLFYVLAAGDSGKIGRAKSMLMYTIAGLLVVVFAGVIVKFVLGLF